MGAYEDAWEEPAAKEWIGQVLDNMAPKMRDSAIVTSLIPEGRGDVKFWVELGASIMMDKPIIGVVFGDTKVPPKLELVADEIVRLEDGVNPAGADELTAAMGRVLQRRADGASQ